MRRVFRHFGAVRVLGVTAVLFGSAWSAAQASAASTPYLYWANKDASSIGRATVNATGAQENFISGASEPEGVAVGAYIYWANAGTNTIGRAKLNGTDRKPQFIKGADAPTGVAVGGQYVYWVNSGNGTIGRAKFNGTDVLKSFIPGADASEGIAVDSQYIYWANSSNAIERASLDGTGLTTLIHGAGDPWGVAVNGQYIYWANQDNDAIGRANLDGTDPKPTLIHLCSSCVPQGLYAPMGIAVSGAYVYWGEGTISSEIGRANLDGTGAKMLLGSNDVSDPQGVAASGTPDAIVTPLKLTGFAPRKIGTSSPPLTATVTNFGTEALAVTKVLINGSDPSDFVISEDTCLHASVQPSSSCKIAVRFKPTGTGPRTARLRLFSNNPSPVAIPLAGGFPWKLSFKSYPQNSTDVPTIVDAITNNVLTGTKDYLNVYVQEVPSSTNYHYSTKCTTRVCYVSLSKGTFVVSADVGPKGTMPFTKQAIVSAKTTITVTLKPPPPGCPPNCM